MKPKARQESIAAFKQAEDALFSILTALETDILKYVEPTNAALEEKKFFEARVRGEPYEPRFTYLCRNPLFAHFAINPEFEKIVRRLKAIEVAPEGFGQMLLNKKEDSIRRMELIRSIGGLDFTDRSIEYYGRPDPALVREARDFLERHARIRLPEEKVPAPQAAEAMRRALKKRGLAYKVALCPAMTAKAAVLNAARVLRIREDAFFHPRDLPRLVAHEIETHIYRFLNGALQPYKAFIGGPWSRWQETEEGLAVVNEELFGHASVPVLKEYAGRVVAVDYALSHGFSDTFEMLCQYFAPKTAYRITQRVKRGTHRPALPGAFTKDYYYFSGRKKVWRFLAEGGDPAALYCGKIAIEEIPFLEEIPELVPPRHLPPYKKRALLQQARKKARALAA